MPPAGFEGHDDGISVDLRGVGEQGIDVDDQARTPIGFRATTESTPPECTSTRREASAKVVSGKSKAIRAGLSIVKGMGSAGGPLRCNLSCTCWPDNVCTSMDSSLFGSAA